MTILDAIRQVDGLKHNTFSQEQKVQWLSRLDSRIHREILSTHEGGKDFLPYGADTPMAQPLLVPEPYEELYLYYLQAQMDFYNEEFDRYNQSIRLFDAAYRSFEADYNRNHRPLERRFIYV